MLGIHLFSFLQIKKNRYFHCFSIAIYCIRTRKVFTGNWLIKRGIRGVDSGRRRKEILDLMRSFSHWWRTSRLRPRENNISSRPSRRPKGGRRGRGRGSCWPRTTKLTTGTSWRPGWSRLGWGPSPTVWSQWPLKSLGSSTDSDQADSAEYMR